MSIPASSQSLLERLAQKRLETDVSSKDDFTRYQYDPAAYIKDKLGWQPWNGSDDHPGQQQIINAYVLALRQQHERQKYETDQPYDASIWQPGQVIQNRIRIEAGHTVGKTKLASGLVNHFFDCFVPSIIYTFAPTWEQIHDLLWKEIKSDRRDKGLPGRVLDLALDRSDDHFAKGRATSNAGGQGTERAQGQHGKYLMFVLDEAEGIADFVYDAVDSMASGGISLVLMLANPRTRSSKFHKAASLSTVCNFRISCLYHPNVLTDRELVPGAVKRQYVLDMVEKHCEVVEQHNSDDHTFELPWQQSVIYKPNAEFLFRVLGIAPANISDNTFVPVGRYEAAKARPTASESTYVAYYGIDVARYGKDYGTLYRRWGGEVKRLAQFWKQDTTEYAGRVKSDIYTLRSKGVQQFRIRVDGGGGFGGGVVDQINNDVHFMERIGKGNIQVVEVHFNGTPYDTAGYSDKITELYAATGDALKVLRLATPPNELEGDLCERMYKWVDRQGISVKRLEPKEDFRKRMNRSPDDGDGCVLAIAPDHLFNITGFSRPYDQRSTKRKY